jgi:hypothetical protein
VLFLPNGIAGLLEAVARRLRSPRAPGATAGGASADTAEEPRKEETAP